MLCCCSSEDGGEREGERREDVEAEGGPAGAADQSIPGPDGGPHPAAGPVGARQGQVRTMSQTFNQDGSEPRPRPLTRTADLHVFMTRLFVAASCLRLLNRSYWLLQETVVQSGCRVCDCSWLNK